MEIRPASGGHWYNPSRDIAPLFVAMLRHSCEFMADDYLNKNHAIKNMIRDFGVREEHFHRAATAMAEFVKEASDYTESHSIEEALGRSGILDLPQPVLIFSLALLGQALMGAYWKLVRSSVHPNLIVPLHSREQLMKATDLICKAFSKRIDFDKENMLKDMAQCNVAPPLIQPSS